MSVVAHLHSQGHSEDSALQEMTVHPQVYEPFATRLACMMVYIIMSLKKVKFGLLSSRSWTL